MKIDKNLINKYNIPVPRYTSYPPANHFTESFTTDNYLNLIEDSNNSIIKHIAIYIHIPFCKKICFYCGCNACTIKSNNLVIDYIKALKDEISLVSRNIDKKRKISQIHFGGGTPNAIDVKFLQEINEILFNEFSFIENPEIAIECNPAYLDFNYLEALIEAKFNRFSLGIQDFNNEVLKSVNRAPSKIPVEQIIAFIKDKSPKSTINLDFIYGLPGQNVENFKKTIAKAIEIRPDRLVTFSYAHVPWIKEYQRILEKKGLPNSQEKIDMFLTGYEMLTNAGYIPIGLDHYVLPKDELYQALIKNQLHRNFQGYCTRRTTGQVYAFGISAISQLDRGYSQNIKDLDRYIKTIGSGNLPVEKGLVLSNEQLIVKEAITRLMCNKKLNLSVLASDFKIEYAKLLEITGFSFEKLKQFENENLVSIKDNEISITEKGSLFIRNIAVTLDPAYQEQTNKYSKSV